jgi:tetratricopeptide (TPR) repeat protein
MVEAEPLFKRSLAIREKALGPGHPDVANSLNKLAFLFRTQGRYAAAEPLYKRAIAIREKALGPDHPAFATPVDNLATLYRNQGRYADAEPLYRRALAIREKAFGADHRDVATTLYNLSELYHRQSRYADAFPLVQTTIRLGRAQPSIALPVLLMAQGNGLIPAGKARDDALNVVQRASQSTAAAAVNKLAVRLAAGLRTRAQTRLRSLRR